MLRGLSEEFIVMNDANMLKPALIGGVALGILSALPVVSLGNCVCCAWAIVGGIVAAYLHIKDSPVRVTIGRGAGVGLAAGAIGAVICNLLWFAINSSIDSESIRVLLREQMERNSNMPEESRQLVEAFISRGDLATLVLITAVAGAIVCFSLFAMLGGAVGVAIFEKRKPESFQPVVPSTHTPPDNF